MKSNNINCISCKYYDGLNCHKNGNVGVIVKYRQENKFYIKTPKEINKNKDCKYYEKA